MALYDSENNRLLDTNDNVLLARSSFPIGTNEVKKMYVGENEVKAIYIGTNLVYEKPISLPQLAAPTISLSGDILSIEEVENAEYYDIYVDGILEESVPAVDLISFNINGTSYQAEQGMTWAEWVDSEYNIDGCYIADNKVWVSTGDVDFFILYELPTDIIQEDGSYTTVGGSN